MLKLTNIVKEYPVGDGSVTALRGVSLDFRESEFVSILGPSGCGKTTLLNIIGGLDHYTSGDLVIRGRSTSMYRDGDWDVYRNHSIGFVFQSYNLIPHQSVLSNVELALTLSGVSKAERRRRAEEVLARVGLGEHIHKRPNQLSGGQMQRVAIARALVNNPDILLADEPTGALDTETSVAVMDLLREVAQEKLVVMVTHNPEFAEEYSSRIIRLLDGKVVGDSNPYTAPEGNGTAASDADGASRVSAAEREAGEETSDPTEKKKRAPREKKRSMSFLTALSLSLNNLMTKKGRTFLTSFAGSIGIIGIALILALSTGINAYITKVQEDTLTSYPISIKREEADISAMLSSLMGASQSAGKHDKDKVYSSAVFYSLINAMLAPEVNTNNLTKFKEYLESGVLDGIDATLQYGYDMPLIIYTKGENDEYVKSDIMALLEKVGFVGRADEESAVGGSLSTSFSSFSVWQEVMPGKNGELVSDIIKEQYDLIHGKWPTEKTDVLLVVDERNEVNDMTLYALGLKSEDEMMELLMSALSGTPVDTEAAVESWDYSEITDPARTYSLLIAGDRYQEIDGVWQDITTGAFASQLKLLLESSLKLRVTGIIRPDPNATSASANGTLLYTSALTDHILAKTLTSPAVIAQLADPTVDIFTGLPFDLDDTELPKTDAEKVEKLLEYVNGKDNEGGLSDAEKAELLHSWLTTPTEEYIAGEIEKALAEVQKRPTEAAKIEFMKNSVKGLIGVFYQIDEEALDVMLDGLVEDNGMDALLDFYASFCTTIAAMQYTANQEAEYESIRVALSDEAYDRIVMQMYTTDPAWSAENRRASTIATFSRKTSMSEALFESWYDGLDAAGKAKAERSAALIVANENYPQYAYAFADKNCAAELDKMLNEADEKTLAWVYDSFVPDGSSSSTYADNLTLLGYAVKETPSTINIYVGTFAEKEKINNIIKAYNKQVESKEDEISYTDYVTLIMSSVQTILDAITYVLIAFVSVSLVVSSIMIGIITYISVLERTKEIGILRAIGASKRDVSRVFNAETLIVGFAAGMIGIIVTLLLCIPINLILRFVTGIPSIGAKLPIGAAAILVAISMLLTFVAGLLPSRIAAKKDPVIALRTE